MSNENSGYCPWCEKDTRFVELGTWLRDQYVCSQCGSIPRQRALITILNMIKPEWRSVAVHESSPSNDILARYCPGYSYSYWFDEICPGHTKNGLRCENIECMTFSNNSLDVFITQDVLEHVFDPERALQEISRVLNDNGGIHVFTVPVHRSVPVSYCRAKILNGKVEYLLPPEYHGNPISEKGSLVTWDYGGDFEVLVQKWSGYQTGRFVIRDRFLGIDGEYLDVFITTKRPDNKIRDRDASSV